MTVLEPTSDYRDGGEDAVVAALNSASDRSDGSDELARSIVDWPTRYHLSPQRSNLLRCVQLPAGGRVLDVGAGTGALSRHLLDRGCEVVAVEGSLARARAAALRCEDAGPIELFCGSLDSLLSVRPDLVETFDAVVVVGVLEYSATDDGAAHLLATAASALSPGGVLVLAIENQLGLQYLAGAPEDHLALPWIGVEGYRAEGRARTWHRAALRSLIEGAGLVAQRWLFPFPDYKLPSAVVSSALYERGDAADLIELFVQQQVPEGTSTAFVLGDVRAAQHTMVEAGLGPDVANSFLVVAGATDDAVDGAAPPETLAWLFGAPRRRQWRRTRRLVERNGSLVVEAVEPARPVERGERWLRQQVGDDLDFVAGRNLASACLDACLAGDEEALAYLLTMWVAAHPSIEPDDDGGQHPFRDERTTSLLSGACLDLDLGNFVLDDDGGLHAIDEEWVLDGAVDRDLVLFRALWNFARLLVTTGRRHPWPIDKTVDDVALGLAQRAGVPADAETLARFRTAERTLQDEVTTASAAEFDAYLDASRSVAREFLGRRGSLRAALETAIEADQVATESKRRAEAAFARVEELEAALAAAGAEIDRLTADWFAAKAELRSLEIALRSVEPQR